MSARIFPESNSFAKAKRLALVTCAAAALACGCRQAEVTSQPVTAAQVQAPLPRGDYIPQSTVLALQLGETLGTENSKVGDRFTANVINDLQAADGRVVVPSGSVVTGVVTELKKSGHV